MNTPPVTPLPDPPLSGFSRFNMLFLIACVVFAVGVALRLW